MDEKHPAWREKVSQPTHNLKVQRNVRIQARDGTVLACDVYLPERPGRYRAPGPLYSR